MHVIRSFGSAGHLLLRVWLSYHASRPPCAPTNSVISSSSAHSTVSSTWHVKECPLGPLVPSWSSCPVSDLAFFQSSSCSSIPKLIDTMLLPASFYLGTALNDHFKHSSDPIQKTAPPAFLSDSPVSATPSEAGSITSNTPRHAAIAQISPEEEQAMLRDKLKK